MKIANSSFFKIYHNFSKVLPTIQKSEIKSVATMGKKDQYIDYIVTYNFYDKKRVRQQRDTIVMMLNENISLISNSPKTI